MKNQTFLNKKILKTLKRLILTYGGKSSLRCPSAIAKIQEDLAYFHLEINDEQLTLARTYMNKIKPKV